MSKDAVAIILLNWNSYRDTYDCLKSLEDLDHKNIHVFLADNKSKDDSFNTLKKDFRNGVFNLDITFIQTGANLGFAGGNNVAIKEAYKLGYYYFWLLNNDTVVNSNALSELLSTLKSDTSVGIVGSKIYYFGTNSIWFAGGTVNTWTGRTSHIGQREVDSGQFDQMKEIGYITGCSLCFPRPLLEEIGYMKEEYFLYYEETDWNLRARNKGWKIVYNPKSIVYHKVSMSTGGEKNPSPIVAFYDLRNAYWMIKNTQPRKKHIVALCFKYLKAIKKLGRVVKQNNKLTRIKYIGKALISK